MVLVTVLIMGTTQIVHLDIRNHTDRRTRTKLFVNYGDVHEGRGYCVLQLVYILR